MDPLVLTTMISVLVASSGTFLFYLSKYVKKSTCFGNTIEFNQQAQPQQPPTQQPPNSIQC
jgi:hypothetical protein